jgi:hypothetical protein
METPKKETASSEKDRMVDMVKRVASRWVESNVREEYRITVYQSSNPIRNLPNTLRSFRDGRTKLGSVLPITDLGIKVGFGTLEVWSSNRDGLIELDAWVQKHGCETSGIW